MGVSWPGELRCAATDPSVVPQLMEKFVRDDNLLKSVSMTKEINFDFDALHAMVYGYLAGGADDERCLRRSVAAYEDVELRHAVLHGDARAVQRLLLAPLIEGTEQELQRRRRAMGHKIG